ncbi:MAG TPA: endonuclease/exonuclease/phosphatase family protein [Terriglobales bacterium]|nr:endonuclease/exonuclease/phosphatase family protein [Terriglobales bacterium]
MTNDDLKIEAVNIRVVTYNIHKCRGIDRRIDPGRIAEVLGDCDADVIALQEVIADTTGEPERNQAQFIAAKLGKYQVCFGEARLHGGAPYGNAILSRVPVVSSQTYDLTRHGRERRGCLRVDVECGGELLHVFNVHLGTSFFERRHQGRKLISTDVLGSKELNWPTIVVGDFNEWTHGLATRLMKKQYGSVEARLHLQRRRTYPGVLPVFHLDHFYFDKKLEIVNAELVKTRLSLVASDHLPIVAEFKMANHQGHEGHKE